MATHREIAKYSQAEIDRINRLLSIPSLEEMSDEELFQMGATKDQCEGIMYVQFDDGSTLNYDLCRGFHNFYDDVVWTSADGSRDVVLDCMYELDDFDFAIDGEYYSVEIVRV